jgi:DNA-binding MarR family transcriptional regulator
VRDEGTDPTGGPQGALARGEAGRTDFRGLGPTTGALLGLGADLGRLFDHLVRRQGSLTFSQYQLLALLRAAHPEPREPWELGRGLGSGSAHVTMLLDQLQRAGLVERQTHGKDRRRRWVHLTEAGRERVEQVAERVRALESRILEGALTSEEAERMGELAERLRAVLVELTASDLSFLLLAEPGHEPHPEDL